MSPQRSFDVAVDGGGSRPGQGTAPPIELPYLAGGGTASLDAACLGLPRGDEAALEAFEDCLGSRLSMLLALLNFQLLRVGLPEDRLRQALAMLGALRRLADPERKALCLAPRYSTWLGQALTLTREVTGGDAGLGALVGHLAELPLLILPLLLETPGEWTEPLPARIPGAGPGGPLGTAWQLRSSSREPLDVLLHIHDGGTTLTREGRAFAEIPADGLRPGAVGSDVKLADREGVMLEPLVFAGGSIAIGSLSDYPMLLTDVPTGPKFMPADAGPEEAVTLIERGRAALRRYWPEADLDVRHFCRMVVPIRSQSEARFHATHPGLLFVQAQSVNPVDDVMHAQEMIHEVMHSKLWAVNTLVPLVTNDGPRLYHHPWREDARPIMGVFLGAHAFLAEMGLYYRVVVAETEGRTGRDFAARFDKLRSEVGQALDVLERGAEFTAAGRALMTSMVADHEKMSYN